MATFHQPLLDTPRTSHCKTLSLFLSFVAIISSTALVAVNLSKPSSHDDHLLLLPSSRICDQALDRASCLAMVSELASDDDGVGVIQMKGGIDLHTHILQIFLKKSASHITDTLETAKKVNRQINDNPREQAAVADCVELMDLSMDRIRDSILALGTRSVDSHSNAHAWLSSVLTNHVTCLDGLNGPARPIMESGLRYLISRASTSLAVLVAISPMKKAEVFQQPLNGNLPSWVTGRDRKLLEISSAKAIINANVVVAKDGSGNYKTVKEAIASAPDNGNTRYTIYVKKGTYKENVEVGKKKKNVMLTGDGMDLTIITGSLNVVDGSTTFNSATVAVVGDGFMAQDICFQNTAGPQKHQAVALRVSADQVVINRCKIDAYQDTLYTHTNRQFYRDCYITGTVDFIFGNAGVVLQTSKIVARKPASGQKNMVTAQGRTDPNQNTGTSIQSCSVIASSDLEPVKASVKSYLGRPWKEYSRTVVMQSTIGDHIDSTGWSEWDKDFALKTLYYGEYMNTGAGAGTSNRVKWAGYHVITSAAEAKKFTVAELIQGGSWLKSTGVAYTEGL